MGDDSITAREFSAFSVGSREERRVVADAQRIHGLMVYVLVEAHGPQARRSEAATRAHEAFVEALQREGPAVRVSEWLRAGVRAANDAIFEEELPPPSALAYSSSLLAAVLDGETLVLAHIGNAQAYLHRASFVPLLEPHSAVRGLPSADSNSAFGLHNRLLFTRALGMRQVAEPDIVHQDVVGGDLIMMLTDALQWCAEEPAVVQLALRSPGVEAMAETIRSLSAVKPYMQGGAVLFRVPTLTLTS